MTAISQTRRRDLPDVSTPTAAPQRGESAAVTISVPNDGALVEFARRSGASTPTTLQPTLRYEPLQNGAVLFAARSSEASAVSMNDVRQGVLNDCYFLSTVAAIANTPKGRERIEQMLHFQSDGKVQVKFASQTVSVEPHWLAFGGAGFGGGGEAQRSLIPNAPVELWPAVLEAGYAQARGETDHAAIINEGRIDRHDPRILQYGYEKIGNCGNPAEPIAALLGVQSTKIDPDAGAIKAALANPNAIVIFETETNPGVPGLRGDHAFTVIGMKGENVIVRDPITGNEGILTPAEVKKAGMRVTTAVVP